MKYPLFTIGLLALSSVTAAQDIPAVKSAADDPLTANAEFALRDQCGDLTKKVITGFKRARLGEPKPTDEMEQAGYELPADTDIASQALRLKRECIRSNAGMTSPTWAAAEVMAQARATAQAALRCIGAGVTYNEPVLDAELELARCYVAEYPGLPASAGGEHWVIQKGVTASGLTLEATAKLGGPQAATICSFVNELSRGEQDPTCRVRDGYSQLTQTIVVREAAALPGDLNQAIREMVDQYRKQMATEPAPAPVSDH